ncbi:SHOCT domain-containing protein [Jatrophihabitans cynanchi]|jgi:putative membrane protein|uniref:SHOCT domain-containing protein n=1 Tax=Jatrophihabitans cynanchi TaxID=2944128 RepID=A0ABY7JZS2_9ACTN|nr:SHOCT domain-containing protein [Jatrophihabitans sp. SB3-54]WAX57768.1 SHOCT domain-containing protein [Jatrophihabitans sp. SB3-54]
MMHNWGGGWAAGNWLLMGFGMLLFWGFVVAGIIWLVRHTADRTSRGGPAATMHGQGGDPSRPRAQDILDERYARGEISDEEYRTRRATLVAR